LLKCDDVKAILGQNSQGIKVEKVKK